MCLRNLPKLINDSEIKRLIGSQTSILSLKIDRDPDTFLSKGTAVIEFDSSQALADAIAVCDNAELKVRFHQI